MAIVSSDLHREHLSFQRGRGIPGISVSRRKPGAELEVCCQVASGPRRTTLLCLKQAWKCNILVQGVISQLLTNSDYKLSASGDGVEVEAGCCFQPWEAGASFVWR